VIVADTSGLYAIFNRRQPEHRAARAAVERDGGPLVLSPLVLAELDHFILARLGAKAEQLVLAELRSPAYRLDLFTDDDFTLASEVAVKYSDMQLGLTDASIVVQAARHKTTRILSLDHTHFGVMRPLTRDASFTLLPRDDQP
jgi:predicted nucleic acid-binding protein